MAGTPHYKNSKISMNNWEPVYTNLFEILLTLPVAIQGEPVDLLLEEVTKISGLATDQTPPAGVEQIFKGAKRRFANALPDATTVDLSLDFNVNLNDDNSAFAYKTLRKWADLVWDPLRATMMLKKDYVGGPMTVSLFNRINDTFRQWTFPTIWPTTSLPPIDLDYSSGSGFYAISGWTVASDYWEDVSL